MLVSLLILGTLNNLVKLDKVYSNSNNYTSSGEYFYPYEKKAEFELEEWVRINTPME